MSSRIIDIDDKDSDPSYVVWRGELLAELALARVPGLIVNKRPVRPDFDLAYDFLVVTDRGACFFVDAKAFSSSKRRLLDIGESGEWRWHLDAALVRDARRSRSPFVLFLFDADREEGRYLRLDTLPAPSRGVRRITVRLPVENTINRPNLETMIASLQAGSSNRIDL
jgi:hypothetical protein